MPKAVLPKTMIIGMTHAHPSWSFVIMHCFHVNMPAGVVVGGMAAAVLVVLVIAVVVMYCKRRHHRRPMKIRQLNCTTDEL